MGWVSRIRRHYYAKLSAEKEVRLRASSRLPVVPTKFGLAFFALLVVMLVWVINHQLNLGYALIFILTFLSLFSAAITVATLAKLRLSTGVVQPVFAGDEAYFPIVIHDERGRARGAIGVRNEFFDAHCDGVDCGEQVEVLLKQPTAERGWQAMLPFEIFSTIPLDLFVSWTWLRLDAQILVYPAPVGNLPIPLHLSEVEGAEQHETSGDDEWVDLKKYQEGDQLSRVAWKHLGRGEMLVKKFAGVGGERVILDYNRIAGAKEVRLSQLARWVVDAEKAGFYYALHLPTEKTISSRGNTHYHHCLTLLAVMP